MNRTRMKFRTLKSDQYLKAQEVADLFGVDTIDVAFWRISYRFPEPVLLLERLEFWRKSEIDHWLAKVARKAISEFRGRSFLSASAARQVRQCQPA